MVKRHYKITSFKTRFNEIKDEAKSTDEFYKFHMCNLTKKT